MHENSKTVSKMYSRAAYAGIKADEKQTNHNNSAISVIVLEIARLICSECNHFFILVWLLSRDRHLPDFFSVVENK